MTLEDVVMNAKYQMADDGLLDQTETCDRVFASAGPNYIYKQDPLPDILYGNPARIPEQTSWDDIRDAINAVREAIGLQRLGITRFRDLKIDTSWLNCKTNTKDAKHMFPFMYDMYSICMAAQKYAYVEGCALEYVIRAAVNGDLPNQQLARNLRRIVSMMRNSDKLLNKAYMESDARFLAARYQDLTGKCPVYYCVTDSPVATEVLGIYQSEIAITFVVETNRGNFRYHSYTFWGVDYEYMPVLYIETAADLLRYKCKTPKSVKQFLDKTWK